MTENQRDSAARDGNTDAGRVSHVPTDAETERLALFIAHRADGRQWSIDCPEWVRDRYRQAARLAWQHVLDRNSAARDGNTDAGRASHVWTCRSCGSHRWVSISLNGGVTCKRQCVPCGKVADR